MGKDYLNNIHNSFQGNDLCNFQENMQSSKDLSFIEINRQNKQDEFTLRRRTVKEPKFSRRMEIFKSEFSFNTKIVNQKSNKDLNNNYSSANGDSSLSNFDKNKEIDINYLRANSTKIDDNFLDKNRLSGNFKVFMNSYKKGILKNINNSKYKNKFIKYIRYELKDLENNKRNPIKHQSCKSLYDEQLNDKITGDENLFFLSKKESSAFDDENLSFFSFDKKSNVESQSPSNSFVFSEKENNKNEFILNKHVKFFLSTKENNESNKSNDKNEFFLTNKTDATALKINTQKNNRRKSLFKTYNE